MNEIFEELINSGWKVGEVPYSLINKHNYVLIEDTGSWMMLMDPEGERIWDYPVLSSYKGWVCNSINRECKNYLLLKNSILT